MPTNDSSGTPDPWGIFEPVATTIEVMLPIRDPVLQEMYAHIRREWWYACHRMYRLLVEASRYGPSTTGANVNRVAEALIHYEGAMEAIRSADLQLRRAE